MQAGYTEEAADWSHWLLRAVAGDPAQLQIMYGAAGERRLTEVQLTHLAGYENSVPVRIGNAASEQLQLDVYGEVMDAMHLAREMKIECDPAYWHLQRHLVDFVEANWRQPDEGIWEIRGPRRHFTHSKVMAWVAIDRAVRAVEEFGLDGPVERWRVLRDAIHAEVCGQGFHPERKAFTQFYGSDKLDAALLMIPLVGFLPATDERVRTTIELIEKELVIDGFVQRYHPEESASVDGLPPGEGSFLPCSFWLVDCLHLLGREKEAREMFRRLLDIRTGLGLISEEYDQARHRLIGNFPQAFTHVGLVNTARKSLAERRPGRASRRPLLVCRPHRMPCKISNGGNWGPRLDKNGVTYRIWALGRKKVSVQIERAGGGKKTLELKPGPEPGYFSVADPEGRAGDLYKYAIDGAAPVPDFMSHYQPARR